MLIRAGFDITLECPYQTPMVLLLSVHPERQPDLLGEDAIATTPPVPWVRHDDLHGNICHRLVAPPGAFNLSTSFVIRDTGAPDPAPVEAEQVDIERLPTEALPFLLGSRYCETDLLSSFAWRMFGDAAPGWPRVQAIVDFVHGHLRFDYAQARATRTAFDAFQERVGVCRDFTHLAIALCRCMNIPARYCNGYLGDIGVPPDPAPMDFNAWFEAYLGGEWRVFDARHNQPRIGRVLVARGMDAADVAMITAFGNHTLRAFTVHTEEIVHPVGPHATLQKPDATVVPLLAGRTAA